MAHNIGGSIATRLSLLKRLENLHDEASWQDFFDTYWKLIYGVARKANLNDSDAQDVVQEVMRSVVKEMPKFKFDPAKGSFKSWLLIRTRWKIVDQFRKRGPLGRRASADAGSKTQTDLVARLPDPASLVSEAIWETQWKESLFAAALAKVKLKLDPRKSQIFDFNAIKGWPAEKVAEVFQVPVPQVHLTKHRVTKMIEAEVKRLERETT